MTVDATYGMKDASAGQLIFCLSRGQHPSLSVISMSNEKLMLSYGNDTSLTQSYRQLLLFDAKYPCKISLDKQKQPPIL